MNITYLDHMGSDLTVVNSARVSFNKRSEWEWVPCPKEHGAEVKALSEKDARLIKYLAEHGHWTPFSHPQLQVHVKAPIFVARQLDKHQVGLTRNEISRRYVDYKPEFFVPEEWRGRAKDKKQGSSGTIRLQKAAMDMVQGFFDRVRFDYETLLQLEVCPEQARLILPQAMYTEWYWTGSLYAFARVVNLRCQPDAQKETNDLISQLIPILKEHWPISAFYLLGEHHDNSNS